MGLLGRLRKKSRKLVPYCAAVVPAAGSAVRMEGREKLLLPLGDMPVLARTLEALEGSDLIREIVVVTRSDLIAPIGRMCKDYSLSKVTKVVMGGETRSASVFAGLREVGKRTELVAIHDGARPLVTRAVIDRAILQAASCGAAAPAIPVKDTIKRAAMGMTEESLDRGSLFAVQTPQVFRLELIQGALQKALEEGSELTDDCAAVERLGMRVALTEGSEENIKLTTPTDLLVAEALLQGREGA